MSHHKEVAWLLQEKYHGEQTPEFHKDSARLLSGEPLAYLIGHIPFLSATIWLDSRPLIPRVETEYWVEKLISHYRRQSTAPRSILDLCAGSGCIGVTLGMAFPDAAITFAEIDNAHHTTITKNCFLNHLSPSRFSIVGGDLFTDIPPVRFSLIVSNPPYVDPEHDRTTASVRHYEPALALYGGQNGLAHLKKIITDAPHFLSLGGELWLEHEPEQSVAVREIGREKFTVHTHIDQYGHERFTQLMLQ